MYGSSVFGYLDFSAAQKFATTVMDPETVRRQLLGTKHPADLIEHLMHAKEISLIDLQDWCEADQETSRTLLSFLVRKHALYRDGRVYVKTSEFITLLKAIKAKGVPTKAVVGAKDEY